MRIVSNQGHLPAKWFNCSDPDPHQWHKSPPRGWTLEQHIAECLHMVRFLLDESPFGRLLHEKMHLTIPYKRFILLCTLAVLLHDLGKASSGFQEMLDRQDRIYWEALEEGADANTIHGRLKQERMGHPQPYRHEWLSGCLLVLPVLWKWLVKAAGSEEDAFIVACAVRGHHIKTDRVPEHDETTVMFHTREVERILSTLIVKFGLRLPAFPLATSNTTKTTLEILGKADESFWLKRKDDETPVSLAVKWVLILADSFGSMTPPPEFQKGHVAFREYLFEALQRVFAPLKPWDVRYWKNGGSRIDKDILDNLHDFQQRAYRTPPQTDLLIDFACGGGKSAAAFLAVSDDFLCSTRVIFTETTTGAAAHHHTETGDPDRDSLRTSRARIDHKLLGHEPLVGCSCEEEGDEKVETFQMVQDLQGFRSPCVYATIDQLLGSLVCRRRSIMWLLYLVQNTQVIFDEFHAYDQPLRQRFLQFLKWFPGVRVVALSATVPPQLERDVKSLRPGMVVIQSQGDGIDPSTCPRYRFHRVKDRSELPGLFSAEHRTLWRVNRVRVAQSVGRYFQDAIVYHARFPYMFQRRRQDEVINAFRTLEDPVRVVVTQVAQQALDFEAHRIISEMCPPDEFLQAIGRSRDRGVVATGITPIYFYAPDVEAPYRGLGTLNWWFDGLLKKDMWSQRELDVYSKASFPGKPTELPAGEMKETHWRSLRDMGRTVTVMLSRDLPKVRENPEDLQLYTFATYVSSVRGKDQGKFRNIPVVPFCYDSRLGVIENDANVLPFDPEGSRKDP